MGIFKIFVSTRKKDGTITKHDSIVARGETKELAILKAITTARSWGYKGKVHIGRVFLRNEKSKGYSIVE